MVDPPAAAAEPAPAAPEEQEEQAAMEVDDDKPAEEEEPAPASVKKEKEKKPARTPAKPKADAAADDDAPAKPGLYDADPVIETKRERKKVEVYKPAAVAKSPDGKPALGAVSFFLFLRARARVSAPRPHTICQPTTYRARARSSARSPTVSAVRL